MNDNYYIYVVFEANKFSKNVTLLGLQSSAKKGRKIQSFYFYLNLDFNFNIIKRRVKSQEKLLLKLWDEIQRLMHKTDPDFRFSSIQINRNFGGKVHVDKHNTTYQYT